MEWLYIAGAIAVVIVLWWLNQPVRRKIQATAFTHYFREVLICSRKGAWIKISDQERGASLFARKLDEIGEHMLLEVNLHGALASELESALSVDLRDAGISSTGKEVSANRVSVELRLDRPGAVEQATRLAVRVFEVVGSPPGYRFNLKGKGHPQLEAFRSLFESMQRKPEGSRSKKWGDAFVRLLDKRRQDR